MSLEINSLPCFPSQKLIACSISPDRGILNATEVGMKALPKKLLPLTVFAIAVTSLLSVQPAQAFTMTLEELGSNVVANGSGAFNLAGLNFVGPFGNGSAISPSNGLIRTGRVLSRPTTRTEDSPDRRVSGAGPVLCRLWHGRLSRHCWQYFERSFRATWLSVR